MSELLYLTKTLALIIPVAFVIHFTNPSLVEFRNNVSLDEENSEHYKEISLASIILLSRGNSAIFVDVRTGQEFESGHLPNAISIPYQDESEFGNDFLNEGKLDLGIGKPIVIYCESRYCAVGKKAAESMARRRRNVYFYAGGWEEWKMLGLSSSDEK